MPAEPAPQPSSCTRPNVVARPWSEATKAREGFAALRHRLARPQCETGGIATDSPQDPGPARGPPSAPRSTSCSPTRSSTAARRGGSSSRPRRSRWPRAWRATRTGWRAGSAGWGSSSAAPPAGARSSSPSGATAASATAAWQENAVPARPAAGLPGHGGGRRRPDLRRRPGLAQRAAGALRQRERPRRPGADELPVVEPGRDARDHRPRRRQPGHRRPALRPRRLGPAPARQRGHQPVRGRRQPRRLARRGRAAHRGLRAHPVQAARPRACTRCRCCSSRRRSTATTSSTSPRAAAWSSTSSAQGQQVFLISWRNPGAAQGHFDLDTYARAVLEARDAVAQITRQPAVQHQRGLLGRHHHRRRARAPRRRPAGSTRSPA